MAGKYQAYRTNKVAQAKAVATPAVSVNPTVDQEARQTPFTAGKDSAGRVAAWWMHGLIWNTLSA